MSSDLTNAEKLAKALGDSTPAAVERLSKQDVSEILHGTPTFKPRWPSNSDKELIMAAIEDQKEMVSLSGGLFKLRYSAYSVNNGNQIKAFVSPVKGFVPCGWF